MLIEISDDLWISSSIVEEVHRSGCNLTFHCGDDEHNYHRSYTRSFDTEQECLEFMRTLTPGSTLRKVLAV